VQCGPQRSPLHISRLAKVLPGVPDPQKSAALLIHFDRMQLVVIGAGNMGCVYGGNLARIGEQVTFVDIWKEHVESIRRNGLHVEGLNGDFTVAAQATDNPDDAPRADAVIICVNAYSTADAARSAQSILKDHGYCLTLQNGVGNIEVLTDLLGRQRVLAGLSFQSGELTGPGRITHTNNGPTYLGELDRSHSERLTHLRQLFDRAGLNPVLVDDVVVTVWTKFVHNCGINAICAITGLRPGYIQEVPELDEFQTRIIQEAEALVRAKGITLDDPDPVHTIKEYCAHKFHRPSMTQHLDRGRPTEIDALNGYVARESKRLGLAAPYNDALCALIKGRQHHPAGPQGGHE
jgi:2-dehydropantoate 2-reductase